MPQTAKSSTDDSTKSEGADWRSFWRVFVAILTGLIPVLTLLGPRDDESHPLRPVVITLVLVVVALAALQFYGQNRENLEKLESRTLIAALFHEIRKDGTREEEEERAFDNYRDDSGVAKTESKLAQPERSVVAGSSQFGSELAVSPKRDERTIAILKNDQRPNYDQDDEHFLEYYGTGFASRRAHDRSARRIPSATEPLPSSRAIAIKSGVIRTL
jgi:hypothetical protein